MSYPSHLRVLRREPIDAVDDGPAGPAGPAGRAAAAGRAAPARRAVLVHGSMDRATSFTRLMARLPCWSIVSYDRRGYAGSAAAGPPASFEDQVDDLLSVLDDEPAVAFGHSYGGDVVLAAAARRPDLIPAALVWEPPQPWLEWWPDHSTSRHAGAGLEPEERAEWFMRRMVGDRIWERLPSTTRAQRRSEGHTFTAEMQTLALAPVFDVTAVRIPVVAGRGGRSRPHQRRSVGELAASLPAGEMAEIADAGHGAHLSHPAELATLFERAASRVGDLV
jgi:pimeloyl-ACP methyl ester carboxylesterase